MKLKYLQYNTEYSNDFHFLIAIFEILNNAKLQLEIKSFADASIILLVQTATSAYPFIMTLLGVVPQQQMHMNANVSIY